ncbi:MAG: hypothetical protein ABR592_03305 [Nitriliruptorales bacterium]
MRVVDGRAVMDPPKPPARSATRSWWPAGTSSTSTCGRAWQDYFDWRRDPDRETRALVRKLERLGHHVTLAKADAA